MKEEKELDDLVDMQCKFTQMIGKLIEFAYKNGYSLTFGDAYRDPRCSYGLKQSLHRKRLAVDFNLFKNKKFLTKTDDHKPLGLFWESLGGSWGGRFGDGNHYSFKYNGVKGK